jgi:hypothetical protein
MLEKLRWTLDDVMEPCMSNGLYISPSPLFGCWLSNLNKDFVWKECQSQNTHYEHQLRLAIPVFRITPFTRSSMRTALFGKKATTCVSIYTLEPYWTVVSVDGSMQVLIVLVWRTVDCLYYHSLQQSTLLRLRPLPEWSWSNTWKWGTREHRILRLKMAGAVT